MLLASASYWSLRVKSATLLDITTRSASQPPSNWSDRHQILFLIEMLWGRFRSRFSLDYGMACFGYGRWCLYHWSLRINWLPCSTSADWEISIREFSLSLNSPSTFLDRHSYGQIVHNFSIIVCTVLGKTCEWLLYTHGSCKGWPCWPLCIQTLFLISHVRNTDVSVYT